ncbi:MAG: host attachment protein [Alphaproteobacteria bacterium]|nr:host attachment protein [Alphaproteobacteria bacterium]
MFKQKKTWVLVADGARARIFIKNYKKLNNVTGQDYVGDNLKDSDAGTDRPGRGYESANPARHAYQPRTDWHQYHKELFAKELCDVLEKANEHSEFDELIIISPPKTLGDIRGHLSKHTLGKVIAEIPKEITKLTEHELVSYLDNEL